MSERKLATIRRIDALNPIEGADRIETATIGGWKVVCQKGLYSVGDLVVYCEIDSWIPTEVAPFLTPSGREPKEYNRISGEKLRTVKLRGVTSQGLLLPLSETNVMYNDSTSHTNLSELNLEEGADVTELLGILKWEAPIPACLSGMVNGVFPSWIPKTDEERCLSGDSKIETDKGYIPIKDICENKIDCSVLSYCIETKKLEWKKVIGHSLLRRSSDWYKITTKSGNIIKCTSNHRIWCEDIKSYRLVSDLVIGQKLITKTY